MAKEADWFDEEFLNQAGTNTPVTPGKLVQIEGYLSYYHYNHSYSISHDCSYDLVGG